MSNSYPHKPIAVFGASENTAKYGYKIFHTLHEQGFTVYGINPKGGQIDGQKLYTDLSQIPGPVEVAILVIAPAALIGALAQCQAKGVREVWFQPGARSAEALAKAQQAGMHAVEACFMAENGLW